MGGPSRREQRRAQRRQVRATERQMAAYGRDLGPQRRSLPARIVRGLGILLLSLALVGAGLWFANPSIAGSTVHDRVRAVTDPGPHGPHAFVLEARNGGAVGWDPCEPIRYVVNSLGAPMGWEQIVEDAVGMVAEASGFAFEYVGHSDARPLDDPSVIRGAPLLISWADPTEVPDLAEETIGVAYTHPILRANRSYFVSGVIALDSATFAEAEAAGDDEFPVFILAHELGHILGLDHVDAPDELMNEEYVGQDGFGPGDLEGLREVHDVPCA